MGSSPNTNPTVSPYFPDLNPTRGAGFTGAGLPWGPMNTRPNLGIGGSENTPREDKVTGNSPPMTGGPVAPPAPAAAPTPSPFSSRDPGRNTGAESSFRNAYLSALRPNTAFTFNAQNPNTFGSRS